ncbi:MAG: FAD:protein FMN transferase [Acidobacteriota bacterium]|nr:FAD:protein FMN transferase [Acidobacteriota bacterium]
MKFTTWGVTGTLATEHPRDEAHASERLWHWIDLVDAACNRFRADSEITRLNRSPGQPVTVSATLELALDAALRSAGLTDGLCDPTVLPALLALGYDRDYDELAGRDQPDAPPVPAAGVGAITWDRERHTVTLAPGCQIDLGASAKALTADLVAAELGELGGVVVEIGGDVAVRGRGPQGPWAIGVSDSLVLTGSEPRISLDRGGVATSSAATRTWRTGGRTVNHVIDPRTGRCAQGPYATATVAGPDCVTANAFATAALLWGEDAPYHVAQAGLSARLVRRDATVEFVGGWPVEEMVT